MALEATSISFEGAPLGGYDTGAEVADSNFEVFHNKQFGRVTNTNDITGATTFAVSNTLVTADSLVFVTITDSCGGKVYQKSVSPSSGSFNAVFDLLDTSATCASSTFGFNYVVINGAAS